MEGTSHKNLQAVYHAFPPMARGNFAKRGKLEFVSLKENIDTATPQGRFMLTVFAMELTSKQRAQLRSMANDLDTIVHVGKEGVGENLIKQADDALEARELIKGKVLENSPLSPREGAEELAKATRSQVVQVIGTKFVLYRETHGKPKEKRIKLVK